MDGASRGHRDSESNKDALTARTPNHRNHHPSLTSYEVAASRSLAFAREPKTQAPHTCTHAHTRTRAHAYVPSSVSVNVDNVCAGTKERGRYRAGEKRSDSPSFVHCTGYTARAEAEAGAGAGAGVYKAGAGTGANAGFGFFSSFDSRLAGGVGELAGVRATQY